MKRKQMCQHYTVKTFLRARMNTETVFFPFHDLMYSNCKHFFLVVTVFEESVGNHIFLL